MLIPGTNLLVHGGKESIFYLMSLSNLGHEQSGNNQIVEHFSTTGGAIHGGPVFWNRTGGPGPTMYVWPNNISLQAYQVYLGPPLTQIRYPRARSWLRLEAPVAWLTLSAEGSMAGTGIVWSSMATQSRWRSRNCPGSTPRLRRQRPDNRTVGFNDQFNPGQHGAVAQI